MLIRTKNSRGVAHMIAVLIFFTLAQCTSKPTHSAEGVEIVELTDTAWVTLINNEKINDFFERDGKIYCGEIHNNHYPLEGVDVTSFKVLPASMYAKDKDHVFYPLSIICSDGETTGCCYCIEYVVEGADVATFRFLGNEYAVDKDAAYFRGRKISEGDAASFNVLKGAEFMFFARDKDKVFMHERVVPELDPGTLAYEPSHPLNDTLVFRYILKDKSGFWEYTPPLQIKLLKAEGEPN